MKYKYRRRDTGKKIFKYTAIAFTVVSAISSASHAQTVLTGDTYSAPEVITTPNWDVNGNLIIGDTGIGTMTTTEGAKVNSLTGIIGLGTDGYGAVTISGTGSEWNNSAGLIVASTGTGNLHILDGAVVTSSNTVSNVVIGDHTGSTGHMVVSGAGSQLQANGTMYVGLGGDGRLDISNGANVATRWKMSVGDYNGSTGYLTVAGNDSTLNTAELRIGENGKGVVSITEGAQVNSAWFFIGTSAGGDGELLVSGADTVLELSDTRAASIVANSGKGKLTLADGALLRSKGSSLIIGSSAGSDGQLIVTGEGTRLQLDNSLMIGSSGTGRLEILDGAEVIALTNTYIGSAPVNNVGHGMLTLQGNSTLTTSTLYVGMIGADGILNIGAALGETAATAGKLITKSGISLGYGGGKGVINFNHTASDYEFNSKIEGDGGVNVMAGTTLMTVKNTYRGSTMIDGGILALKGLGGISNSSYVALNNKDSVLDISTISSTGSVINNLSGIAGSQVVLSDKSLSVNSSNDTVYAGDITGHKGGLTKLGERTLTLAGRTAYTGNTRLNKGQLVLDGSEGGAQLSSNVLAYSGTQLSMINGASLTGAISRTSVSIDGASRWNMIQSSDVDQVVNFGLIDFTSSSPDNRLTIQGDYTSDNGRLIFNSALGGDESHTDKLIVEGDTYGTTLVSVNNAGGSGAMTLNGIELVQVNGISGGEFIKNGRIVAGAYDYSLARGVGSNASNWYLTSTTILTPPTDPESPKLPKSPELLQSPMTQRPESGAYGANLAAANNMFVTRLHDRIGGTQYIDALTGELRVTSLWLRNEGGHNRSRDTQAQLRTQSNRYVTQLGGDIAQWSYNGVDSLHLGVMAGYGNSKSTTESQLSGYSARASVDGYSTGVYGIWYADSADKTGLYVDSWAQYSWFNNTVNGQDLVVEEYKSKGVTASVESGYTFKIGKNAAKNASYYIQPKAQVTWMDVKADDHKEANGTHVSGEGDGNIQTRLGVKAFMKGYADQDKGKDRVFQPFVEANWIHNTKDFGTNMDGITVKQAGAGNIGELKLGVEGQINKNVNLWGNVGQQVGNKGYSDTAVMLGVKYNF